MSDYTIIDQGDLTPEQLADPNFIAGSGFHITIEQEDAESITLIDNDGEAVYLEMEIIPSLCARLLQIYSETDLHFF